MEKETRRSFRAHCELAGPIAAAAGSRMRSRSVAGGHLRGSGLTGLLRRAERCISVSLRRRYVGTAVGIAGGLSYPRSVSDHARHPAIAGNASFLDP
jgi:hypothetical protein